MTKIYITLQKAEIYTKAYKQANVYTKTLQYFVIY